MGYTQMLGLGYPHFKGNLKKWWFQLSGYSVLQEFDGSSPNDRRRWKLMELSRNAIWRSISIPKKR